ncbi:MAG TPA: hypothetical protein VF189_03700, partial [Patescibacteria group bacterium]
QQVRKLMTIFAEGAFRRPPQLQKTAEDLGMAYGLGPLEKSLFSRIFFDKANALENMKIAEDLDRSNQRRGRQGKNVQNARYKEGIEMQMQQRAIDSGLNMVIHDQQDAARTMVATVRKEAEAFATELSGFQEVAEKDVRDLVAPHMIKILDTKHALNIREFQRRQR